MEIGCDSFLLFLLGLGMLLLAVLTLVGLWQQKSSVFWVKLSCCLAREAPGTHVGHWVFEGFGCFCGFWVFFWVPKREGKECLTRLLK